MMGGMTRIGTVVLLFFAVGGCTAGNRAALIASTAMLACDWGQTRRAEAEGWGSGPGQLQERNPIMGSSPSATRIDNYFVAAAALNTLLWLVTPQRYRAAAPVAVTMWEARTVAVNARQGMGVCGL